MVQEDGDPGFEEGVGVLGGQVPGQKLQGHPGEFQQLEGVAPVQGVQEEMLADQLWEWGEGKRHSFQILLEREKSREKNPKFQK